MNKFYVGQRVSLWAPGHKYHGERGFVVAPNHRYRNSRDNMYYEGYDVRVDNVPYVRHPEDTRYEWAVEEEHLRPVYESDSFKLFMERVLKPLDQPVTA